MPKHSDISALNKTQLEELVKQLKRENSQLKTENQMLIIGGRNPNRDKVERKIAQQNAQLIKYNKELEQFTYVATHDLKSPLANIQGYLDLLEIDLQNPSDDVKDSMKWLKYSVAEAQEVIRALTNALRARNRRDELLSPIDLEELVESILSGMRSRILANKIVFIVDFSEVNLFNYYPVALRSILQNIISNAIQYSSDTTDPEIFIKTEKTTDSVLISIQDNGSGIDLGKNKEKVFGLFKRVHNDESGSGIGMYIVQKLLENYGGTLELESELGRGSTFTVVIPLEIK